MSGSVRLPPVHPEVDVAVAERRAKTFAVLTDLLLWPGIGHFFIGRRRAGMLWAAGSFALILAAPLHVLLPIAGLVAARPLSAMDARRGSVRFTDRNRTVPWVLVGLCVAFGSMFFQRRFYVEAFKIPTATMAPTLAAGDHLFANKLAYRFGDVERGDVAIFEFPCEPDSRHTMIQRVIGLPGDTVEVRCDLVYVNGRALSQELAEGDCSYWAGADPGNLPFQRRSCSRYSETIDGARHEIFDSPDRPALDRERADSSVAYERVAGGEDFPDNAMPGCASAEYVARAGRIERARPTSGGGGACAPREHYVVPDGHIFTLADNRLASDSRSWGPVPLDLVKGRAVGIWWSSAPHPEGIRWGRIGAVR